MHCLPLPFGIALATHARDAKRTPSVARKRFARFSGTRCVPASSSSATFASSTTCAVTSDAQGDVLDSRSRPSRPRPRCGAIEIETAATEETHVELEALTDNEQVREMVDGARIECNRRGDTYEISVEVRTRGGVWISFSRGPNIRLGSPELRLRISCPTARASTPGPSPATSRHVAHTGSSTSRPRRVTRSSTPAPTPSSKARERRRPHRHRRRTLDVKSVSGDVHVGSVARDATLQNVSGDVYIADAAGSVRASTVSGDQRYAAVVRGRLELRAVSGDIGVAIRRGSRVFIDANTVKPARRASEFRTCLTLRRRLLRLSRKRRLSGLTPPSSRSTRRPSR